MRFSSKSWVGTILALSFVLLVFLSHMLHAQSSNLVLYDNFDERFLSPTKWNIGGACFTNNGMELECVREIRDEKLHLALRNFGNRDTNTGFQFGQTAATFVNPSLIKTITGDLTVQGVAESNCAANPIFGPAAHIDGFFFNTGSGNSSDDIGGHIVFAPDPSGSVVVFGQISQGNNYFFNLLRSPKSIRE